MNRAADGRLWTRQKADTLYLATYSIIVLQLNSISLVQFKNYSQRRFSFHSRIVGIWGPNGVGKTNLLDAIHYLCFTKSYFGRNDSQHAQAGMTGFRIEGNLDLDGKAVNAVCVFRDTGRKEFLLNGSAYERFAHHIGKFPCVIIAPDDVRIITEGSEERRRYIDAILSQLDPEYLQRLINYNKILQQRNSRLKSMAENRIADQSLLDVYDEQLVNEGEFIFGKRKVFLEAGISRVREFYSRISGAAESVSVQYESQLLRSDLSGLLRSMRDKDLFSQRTNAGIHKDDLLFLLNGQPFRSIASQGQRKSLLFALKLTEFDILKENKGFAPLLLLDDVFEKLDEHRMDNLLEWVCTENQGQIFITDTHRDRIAAHLEKLGVGFQLIDLQNQLTSAHG